MNKQQTELIANLIEFLENLIYNTKELKLAWKANDETVSPSGGLFGYSSSFSNFDLSKYKRNEFSCQLEESGISSISISICFDRHDRRIVIREQITKGIAEFNTLERNKYYIDKGIADNENIIPVLTKLEDTIIAANQDLEAIRAFSGHVKKGERTAEELEKLNLALTGLNSAFIGMFQKSAEVDINNPIFKLKINE